MTSRDFCYWLQGFFEVGQPIAISPEQVASIKAHLNMVFRHEIDPSYGEPEYVEILRKIHEGEKEGFKPEIFCADASQSADTLEKRSAEQYPDGAPVEIPSSLASILPADWLSKLPKDGVGLCKPNC